MWKGTNNPGGETPGGDISVVANDVAAPLGAEVETEEKILWAKNTIWEGPSIEAAPHPHTTCSAPQVGDTTHAPAPSAVLTRYDGGAFPSSRPVLGMHREGGCEVR
eukprot:2727618-Heterocapsa_arctica.AAC.1